MRRVRRIHAALLLMVLAGIGLFVFLLVRHNFKDIAGAVGAARWYLGAIILLHLVPLFFDTLAWRVLFPKSCRLPVMTLFQFRWIGEAVSSLLPATQVGGDIIRARLAAAPLHTPVVEGGDSGAPTLSVSAATVLVDITASIFAQILFTLTGLILLAALTGRSNIALPALVGGMLAILAIAVFCALQHAGIFRLLAGLVAKLTQSPAWRSVITHAETFDNDVRSIYARRRDFGRSAMFTLLSWFAGAGEVYVALYALGLNPSYGQAVVLEAVGQGIRSAMFFIPAAIGIQEAGYLGVGSLLGIPAEIALALALIRRVRELAVGIPGLLAWHVQESRRLLRAEAVQS